MKRFIRITFAVSALFVSLSAQAFADITSREVVDALKDYYASTGVQFSVGSEDQSGDTLTLNDVVIHADVPDGQGSVEVRLDWISLIDAEDGAVDIEVADVATIDAIIAPKGEKTVHAVLEADLAGFYTVVEGAFDAMKVTTEADLVTIKTVSLNNGDMDLPAGLTASIAEPSTTYSILKTAGNLRKAAGDFSVGKMTLNVSVKEPKGKGLFAMSNEIASMAGIFSVVLPESFDVKNPFADGLSVDGTYDFGNAKLEMNFQDRNNRFAMTSSADSMHLGTSISKQAISYDIGQKGVMMNISASELPIPALNFAYDELDFGISIPLAQSSEPANARYRTALRGLTVSEAIWSMFDPGQIVPRDPATFAIDMSAKVLVLIDLLNVENLERMKGPPALPQSVTLNELTAAFGGARLKGEGEVKINLANMHSYDGMPQPIGKVHLNLKGGFGLLDKLAELGLVPDDAVFTIRAMSGAFAKPVGDDELETEVEFTEKGGVTVNGQMIKPE